nr:MAG TPA: hypothetical protein [Caudoviricetes sp.]
MIFHIISIYDKGSLRSLWYKILLYLNIWGYLVRFVCYNDLVELVIFDSIGAVLGDFYRRVRSLRGANKKLTIVDECHLEHQMTALDIQIVRCQELQSGGYNLVLVICLGRRDHRRMIFDTN